MYYDGIEISKGIDYTKKNRSSEWMICHYFRFNHWLKFQDCICNGCHDLTMLSVNIKNNAITTIKNVNYFSIIHCKSESTHLLEDSVLEHRGYL